MKRFALNQIAKICERLEARKQLQELAQAYSPINDQYSFDLRLLGESIPETKCNNNPQNPDGQITFSCGNTFKCENFFPTFNCNSQKYIYADCRGSNGQGPPGDYTCEATVACKDNKPVFDCGQFSCVPQLDTGYVCLQSVDHVCSSTFKCISSFICSAGHVHFCPGNYSCADSFECNAGNEPSTTNQCTDAFPYSEDRNGNPGDFFCGNSPDGGGMNDIFNCTKKFTCKPQSEFRCDVDATFFCSYGNESGEFKCTGTDEFDCRPGSSFTCRKSKPFDCVDYKCHAVYTNCKSRTEKECSGEEYNCIDKAGNNVNSCDGKPGVKCGTESKSYNCSKKKDNPYDCSKDEPAYGCWHAIPPFGCEAKKEQYNCTEWGGSSYTQCLSPTKKECLQKYKCPEPNNCVVPDFKCNSPSPFNQTPEP